MSLDDALRFLADRGLVLGTYGELYKDHGEGLFTHLVVRSIELWDLGKSNRCGGMERREHLDASV
jgi:hypothetical protein